MEVLNMDKEIFIDNCNNGLFFVKLPKAFYEREAIFAAAYLFREKFQMRIDSVDDSYVGVWFQTKEGQNQDDVRYALGEFCNETLDQQVRLDLDKRYGALREMIYEHAFKPLKTRKGGV
jgi:His-Xaa-Ser system protein HxsD